MWSSRPSSRRKTTDVEKEGGEDGEGGGGEEKDKEGDELMKAHKSHFRREKKEESEEEEAADKEIGGELVRMCVRDEEVEMEKDWFVSSRSRSTRSRSLRSAEDVNSNTNSVASNCFATFRSLRENSSCVCLFVAVLCALGFVEGISVTGLYNINISNLEKRFELSSSQSGLISASGEIGSICVLLLVSYYGGRSHRPRVIAAGGVVLALGCCFFAIPHIFVGNYIIESNQTQRGWCSAERQALKVNCSHAITSNEDMDNESPSRFLPFFLVGQGLQGIGFSPAFTCGFAYIDDHADSQHTAMYMGVTYALTSLGIGMGYALGGKLLTLWVDIGRVDLSTVDLTPQDKRWVGAWWLGYMGCAVLFIIVSCLLCLFPKSLPVVRVADPPSKDKKLRRASSLQKKRMSLEHSDKDLIDSKSLWQLIMSFPKALLDLVRNPMYVLLVLVGVGDSLIVSGIAAFAAKIIEEQFNVKPEQSGLIMGVVTLLGAAGGMFLGGVLIHWLKLKLRGMLNMCMVSLMLGAILGGICFFIRCPTSSFAGVTTVYGRANNKTQAPEIVDLKAACNSNCNCNLQTFDPVCGQDGITYFTSCHAGCQNLSPSRVASLLEGRTHSKKYENCSCVAASLKDGGLEGEASAISGQCEKACSQVWAFIVLMFLGILFTCVNVTPVSMAILRCLPLAERSVGLGMQWVMLRLLASIPGPIMVGAALDTSCQVWQSSCRRRKGNCWMYDSPEMGLRLFMIWVMVKLLGAAMLLAAYCIHMHDGKPESPPLELNEPELPEAAGFVSELESQTPNLLSENPSPEDVKFPSIESQKQESLNQEPRNLESKSQLCENSSSGGVHPQNGKNLTLRRSSSL